MNISHLPTEIGTLIFTYLDLKTKIDAYSIDELKRFFAPYLVSKIDLSRSTLATAKTLSLSFFQDMAMNILELNLSAIKDLTASQLAPSMRRCVNLKTLDVTFTHIFLCDLDEICCNTLKNIGINFFKPHYFKPEVNLAMLHSRGPHKDKDWMSISKLFEKQKFEKVHFILLEFYNSELPLKFMEDLPLSKNLKITLADRCSLCWDMTCEEYEPFTDSGVRCYINFEKIEYVFCNFNEPSHQPLQWLGGISNLDYTQLEYIFLMYCEPTIHVCVSPNISKIFEPVMCSHVAVNVCSHLYFNFHIRGNIVFKAWNKNLTVFDDHFFDILLKELLDYFPTYICTHTYMISNITKAACNWYCIDSCDAFDQFLENIPEKATLTDVCRHGCLIERNLYITKNKIQFQLLKNLTFLSISNVYIEDNFFEHLFSLCKKLYTLDVYIENLDPVGLGNDCTLSLFANLYQIRLNNLRLNLRDIDYQSIFNFLSECTTLSNIHICDRDHQNEYQPSQKEITLFLERCCNLYSLFIEAEMDENTRNTLAYRLTNTAKIRDHLRVKVCYYGSDWNPFTCVFNPSPLNIT